MKFGIDADLWMARGTDDVAPILRRVADLGFDGAEMSLLGMSDEKAGALAGLIRDHGLEVTCSDGLSTAADITSADPEVQAAGPIGEGDGQTHPAAASGGVLPLVRRHRFRYCSS